MKKSYDSLVLSGGGSKGVVHLGVLEFCWQMGYLQNITRYFGVSVGSIISLFLILDYTPYSIFQLFFNKGIFNISGSFSAMIDIKSLGDRIIKLLNKKITRKTTFTDIYNLTKKHLYIIGCLAGEISEIETDDRMSIFSFLTTPDMPIIDAIEISCALPFIFTDKFYMNEKYIDGCFVNDLPIDVAYRLYPDSRILAVWLKSDGKMEYGFLNDIYRIVTIPMVQMQLLRNATVDLDNDSIDLIEVSVSGTGFSNLSPERKEQVELWGHGFRKAEKYYSDLFMDGWDLSF